MTIKLIIWDLDDTLWNGTLADSETVALFEHRAEMIRAFNARGVVSAICSKNDFETAKAKLLELGLWDEFVFPHIAFTPKPQAIADIIQDMQLRPANVLFVDDNPINLHETCFCLPDIHILDITQPDSDDILAKLLEEQTGTRSRVEEYRALESKKRDRTAAGALSNEEFLHSCEIRACIERDQENLVFADRIADLINRSNQLNYTNSRVDIADLKRDIINTKDMSSISVFAWDKYGQYGLIGFVMIDKAEKPARIVHFVFSCRIMHMGLEEYTLRKALPRIPGADTDISSLEGRFSRTEPNWIEDCHHYHPEVREAREAIHASRVGEEPAAIRIMCHCQSSTLAHFSRNKASIAADSFPVVFRLRDLIDGNAAQEQYPPYIVYGAGIDYRNSEWGEVVPYLDQGLYQQAVIWMCTFLTERNLKALIILPPDNMSKNAYRLPGYTRARTTHFNAIWREALQAFPCITLLEVQRICEPDELSDVNHHHPSAAKKIAHWIDTWYDMVSQPARAAA